MRMRRGAAALGVLGVGAAGAGALLATSATDAVAVPPNTLVVDTLTDGAANPTDCTTPVALSCSLRDALDAADDGDTITFTPGLTGTISLTDGVLLIRHGITIDGPGSSSISIDAHGLSGVLSVAGGIHGSLEIEGISLLNGYGRAAAFYSYMALDETRFTDVVISGTVAGSSGAVYMWAQGDVTFDRCRIIDNETNGNTIGIRADGRVRFIDSMVSGNVVSSNGSAAIKIDARFDDAELIRTEVSDNSAPVAVNLAGNIDQSVSDSVITRNSGTAVVVRQGRSNSISRTTISDNLAGGVLVMGGESFAIYDSTISGNSSAESGSAIRAINMYSGVPGGTAITVANTTIAENESTIGAAVFLATSAPVRFIQSTISLNTSASPRASGIEVSVSDGNPNLSLVGTILAGNLSNGGTTPNDASAWAPVIVGAESSLLGAITDDVTIADRSTDVFGLDPRLAPLADNGGPTRTMALLADSPAIDAGPAELPVFPNSQWDQRGTPFSRVFGGRLDIGAFEAQFTPERPIVPTFTG